MRHALWILLLTATGCVAGGRTTEWTQASNAALQDGVTLRGSFDPMMCPCAPDWHVAKQDRSFVTTFDELRAVLRPIDTPERAVAYRELLQTLDIERDDAREALRYSTPLTFKDEETSRREIYTAADAERWNVPHEPVVETTAGRIVITQPMYMQMYYSEDGMFSHMDVPVVELVREVFHRDGNYERETLRELERGDAASVYEPFPLL